MLGLSALKAASKIACRDRSALRVISETVALPRADIPPRIAALEAEQARPLDSLRGPAST